MLAIFPVVAKKYMSDLSKWPINNVIKYNQIIFLLFLFASIALSECPTNLIFFLHLNKLSTNTLLAFLKRRNYALGRQFSNFSLLFCRFCIIVYHSGSHLITFDFFNCAFLQSTCIRIIVACQVTLLSSFG